MIFWELGSRGLRRYSFITILECSIQSFQASFETLSKTRLPSSPFQGGRSSPGISRPNFTQWTMRVPGFTGSLAADVGPQDSLAIMVPRTQYLFDDTARARKFLVRVSRRAKCNRRGQRRAI